MSLLNFFAKRLLSWQQQPAVPSPDYLLGGHAALEQAQAAFQAEPLFNYLHENHRLQLEMEELGYQLSRARAQETRAQQEAATLRVQLAAAQEAVKKAGGGNARNLAKIKKRIAKLSAAAFNPITRPGTKLKQLQNLIQCYADLANKQPAAFGAPSAPPLPLQP